MSYINVIKDIENLPHYRMVTCSECGYVQKVHTLVIHGSCTECGVRRKYRGHASMGSEIEDVIDTVLAWIGQGERLTLVMERKQTIDSCSKDDWPWEHLSRDEE